MDAHDRALPRDRPARAEPSITSTSTVEAFLQAWLEAKQSPLCPPTYASHEADVRRYLVPYLGNLPLDGLRPAHIERMYRLQAHSDGHGEAPLSVASLRRIHATLTSALNAAVKQGLLDRNPAVPVRLPRGTQVRAASTKEPVLESGPQPSSRYGGMLWIEGAAEPVNFDAASWGDAIALLDDQYGQDSEFVLRTDKAAPPPN